MGKKEKKPRKMTTPEKSECMHGIAIDTAFTVRTGLPVCVDCQLMLAQEQRDTRNEQWEEGYQRFIGAASEAYAAAYRLGFEHGTQAALESFDRAFANEGRKVPALTVECPDCHGRDCERCDWQGTVCVKCKAPFYDAETHDCEGSDNPSLHIVTTLQETGDMMTALENTCQAPLTKEERETAIRLLAKRFAEAGQPLSVKDLAAKVGLSVATVRRALSKEAPAQNAEELVQSIRDVGNHAPIVVRPKKRAH